MDFGQVYKLGRNDICICGSGKKYKKCCLITPKVSESYEITTEPISDINLEANFSAEDRKLYEQISEKMIVKRNADYAVALRDLKSLKKSYPDARRVYNLLGVCYQHLNMEDELIELLLETYERFPDYLFAKTSYVSYWMGQGDYSKFEDVFSEQFDLKSVYPHRSKFHISEALAFYGVCGRYFVQRGNIAGARKFRHMIITLSPNDSGAALIEKEIMLFGLEKLMREAHPVDPLAWPNYQNPIKG